MPEPSAFHSQIQHILDTLGGSAVDNPNWRDEASFDYLHRQGALLVRPGDAERVQAQLAEHLDGLIDSRASDWAGATEGEERASLRPAHNLAAEPVTPGAVRVSFDTGLDDLTSVPDLLEHLEQTLGADHGATPDHVLFLCGHACPATEPEPVSAPEPYPSAQDHPCTCGHCTGAGVMISVLDTGLVPGSAEPHPWMIGVRGDDDPVTTRVVSQDGDEGGDGGSAVVTERVIGEYTGHGTFVAGCARTAAPSSTVHVERGLLYGGAIFESDLAVQIVEGLKRNPDIMVLTYSTHTYRDQTLISLDQVFEEHLAGHPNLVVLAPAGNDSTDQVGYPAAYDWVTGVGALARNWRSRADFSNHGDWVDVFAPGEDLVNAFTDGVYDSFWAPDEGRQRTFTGMARWSGTSFSTPLVAGMIAARMTARNISAPQARDELLALARSRATDVGPVLLPGQGCLSLYPAPSDGPGTDPDVGGAAVDGAPGGPAGPHRTVDVDAAGHRPMADAE